MDITPNTQFEDTAVAFAYKSDAELKNANFIFTLVHNPTMSSIATWGVKVGLALKLPIKGIIRKTVFSHFCGGDTIDHCTQTISRLSRYKVSAILDFSVEGAKTEEGFERTTQEILRTFEAAKGNPAIPFCVFKVTGLADASMLEALQAGKATDDQKAAHGRLLERVDRICAKAHSYRIPVLIDAEHSWIQNPIDDMAYEMMRKYNREQAIVFNTYQMYRTDMLQNMRNALHDATMHNYFLGVKMVRGAYMEVERERAAENGYEDPIQVNKQATDESFNKGLAFCVDNKQRVTLMCGSHNEYSNQYLTVLMGKHGMNNNDARIWFAQLYGMSDNISFNLARDGFNVVKYVPYGPVESVMPYLLRRAEENTSVAGQSSRELMMIRKEIKRRKSENASHRQ